MPLICEDKCKDIDMQGDVITQIDNHMSDTRKFLQSFKMAHCDHILFSLMYNFYCNFLNIFKILKHILINGGGGGVATVNQRIVTWSVVNANAIQFSDAILRTIPATSATHHHVIYGPQIRFMTNYSWSSTTAGMSHYIGTFSFTNLTGNPQLIFSDPPRLILSDNTYAEVIVLRQSTVQNNTFFVYIRSATTGTKTVMANQFVAL